MGNLLVTAAIVNNNYNNIYSKKARVKQVWQIIAKCRKTKYTKCDTYKMCN